MRSDGIRTALYSMSFSLGVVSLPGSALCASPGKTGIHFRATCIKYLFAHVFFARRNLEDKVRSMQIGFGRVIQDEVVSARRDMKIVAGYAHVMFQHVLEVGDVGHA